MKEVDLGEPTSFHDNVYLDVVNENVKREKMLCANTSSWSYDMEGHAKICVERYCELANKTPQQPYKVTTPCLDDHQFKKKNWGLLDKWQNFVFELFSKCLYLARIGRPDILWPVNKLARTVTNWTNACDTFSRFDLLHTPHEWFQTPLSCGEALHNSAGWDCLRTLILPEILKTRKSTSEGLLCIFGSQTFVPRSWVCQKQTSVSHNSTEAKITSLDAGLRMVGIPALDLWDLAIEVYRSSLTN